MKAPFVLMSALAAGGCATVGAQPVQTVSIGQIAIVAGLRVRPVEVLEDSRCPASVQCVWAGRVRLLVDVTRGDGAHQQRDLTLGEPQNIDWGWLTLTSVEPAKQAPGTLDPRAYRFTFGLRR